MCGGPTCTFQGKEVPCNVNVLPNVSITSTMLAEMLSNINCSGVFDHQPDGLKHSCSLMGITVDLNCHSYHTLMIPMSTRG
jgi:hypothetical protein